MFGMKPGGGLRHTEFGNCDTGMPHPSEVRGLAHLLTDSMLQNISVTGSGVRGRVRRTVRRPV